MKVMNAFKITVMIVILIICSVMNVNQITFENMYLIWIIMVTVNHHLIQKNVIKIVVKTVKLLQNFVMFVKMTII